MKTQKANKRGRNPRVTLARSSMQRLAMRIESAAGLAVKARRDVGMGWDAEASVTLRDAINRLNRLSCEVRGFA